MILVVVVLLIVGVAWSLANPFASLILLLGINMIGPGELYPVLAPLHLERTVAILALVVLFARGYRFLYPRITKWVLYFYGACLASIPLSFWVSNAVTNAIDFAKTIVIHLLYVTLVTTRRRMQIVLVAFCCLIGYLCVTSLSLYFQGAYQYTMNTDRIMGLTGAATAPDSLGLTLVTAMPIAYLFTRKPCGGWLRLTMWCILALAVWTMLLTGARGVTYTFLLLLVIAVLLHRRRLLLLPMALVFVGLLWISLPAQYKARYSSVNDLQQDASYQNRLLSWEGGWHMFLHNPLTGIGIGNYTAANGALYWPAPHRIYLNAHSIYFKLLGELGLGGLITFAGLVTVLIKTNNQVRRRLRAIDAAAREGDSRAETVPDWLRLFPTASTLIIIELLYCGYGYHDLYRSTWYFLAAASAAADLLTAREMSALAAAPEATTVVESA